MHNPGSMGASGAGEHAFNSGVRARRGSPLLILTVLLAFGACAPVTSSETGGALSGSGRENSAPAGNPEGLLRMADNFKAQGDYSSALNLYNQAGQYLPDDPRPLSGIASIYAIAGARAEAAQVYRRVLDIDPTNAQAAAGIAEHMLYQERGETTVQFIENFLAQAEGNAALYNILGVAHDLLGNQTDAQLAYAEGLDHAPNDPDITNNLALSFAVRGDYQTAIGLLQRVLSRPSAQESGRQNLALIYALSGQMGAALEIAGTVLSEEEVAINRVFYSRLPSLTQAEKAQAVFLGKLPEPRTGAERPAMTPQERAAEVVNREEQPDGRTNDARRPLPAPSTPDVQLVEEPPPSIVLEAQPTPTNDDELSTEPAAAATRHWVQLGSYRSHNRARRGWNVLSEQHSALLEGFKPFIQTYESEGRGTYFRLLLEGYETRSAANTLCGRFKEQGLDCIVLSSKGTTEPL